MLGARRTGLLLVAVVVSGALGLAPCALASPLFVPAPSPPALPSAGAGGMVAGEFNGDSHVDLAAGDPTGNSVSVLIGNGQGGFTPASTVPVGSAPTALATGDFNSDGKRDIVSANYGDGTATVLLGDGHGGFSQAPGSPVALGAYPRDIVVGDFNADGHQDTAATTYDGVVVLLGDGSGRFSPAPGSPYTSVPYADALAAGFFVEGEAAPGLAVVDGVDDTISILNNDGHANFTLAPGSPVPDGDPGYGPCTSQCFYNAISIDAATFRTGGMYDVAVGHDDGKVSMLLGDGQGHLSVAPGSPFPARSDGRNTEVLHLVDGYFNNDSNLDLATADYFQGGCGNPPCNLPANSVSVLLGDGTGHFAQAPGSSYYLSGVAGDLAAGDFNGDARSDLAATDLYSCHGNAAQILLNQGPNGTTSTPAATYPGDGCPNGGSQPRAADCYDYTTDGLTPIGQSGFDAGGVDTEPGGRYCQEAMSTLGFQARWDRNVSAQQAAAATPDDGVFYFAGHTADCTDSTGKNELPDSEQSGQGVVFVDRNNQPSLFLGYTNSSCLAWTNAPGVVKQYNMAEDLRGANLVVIQGCFSGHDTNVNTSIASQIYALGARTVVGFLPRVRYDGRFGEDVGSNRPYGDAWAAGFWGALKAGQTVSQAVDAADGYELYITGDPTNDPYTRNNVAILGAGDAAPFARKATAASLVGSTRAPALTPLRAKASSAPARRLTRALSGFLHRRLRGRPRWTAQAGPRGTEFVTSIRGVGLFVVGSDGLVHEAVFDQRGHGRSLSRRRAEKRAAIFARRHYGTLKGFSLRRHAAVGNRAGFDFLWQAHHRGAWLPSFVEVGVRANGSVALFAADSSPTTVKLTPRVSKARAKRIAMRLVRGGAGTAAFVDGLAVRNIRRGVQKLVWMVGVRHRGPIGQPDTMAWIDAATGKPV